MTDQPDQPEPLTPAEKAILRSLRRTGDLAPELPDEVEAAENSWDEVTDEDLPDSLRDPVTLAAFITAEASIVIDAEFDLVPVPLEAELARVARMGNDISADIEIRMERDRAATGQRSSAAQSRRNTSPTIAPATSNEEVPSTSTISPARRAEIAELAGHVFTEYYKKPPTDPLHVLALHGVTYSFGHYGEAFDGLLEYDAGEFHVFCNVDRDNTPGSSRARFTLAHELGHYLLDDHRNALMSGRVKPHPSKNNAATAELLPEREADLFAACFLMPASFLRMSCPKAISGYDRIRRLAEIFEVSLLCAAVRYVETSTDPAAIIMWNADGYAWKRVSVMLWALGCRKSVEDVGTVPPDSATGQMIFSLSGASRPHVIEGHSTIEAWFPYVSRSSVREMIVRESAISLGRFGTLTLLEPVDWRHDTGQSALAGLVDAATSWSSN